MYVIDRNEKTWQEIERWEAEFFKDRKENSFYYVEEQFNSFIASWHPSKQKKILTVIDSIIFHLHAILQNSYLEKELRMKVMEHGRIFNNNIEDISDMKCLSIDQLRYIANKNLARQRLIALAQGSVAGIGSIPLLALDLPMMLLINLRSIQMTAMTYGYDLIKPYEMMLALKVFHVSTLPKTMQKEGWHHLLVQLDSYEDEWLFFDEQNSFHSTVWLQQPVKQLAKDLFLLLYKKKLTQSLPFVGITVGGATNYFLAKQVSVIAHRFYQKRFLLEQKTMHIPPNKH